jgi:hypothetical protein
MSWKILLACRDKRTHPTWSFNLLNYHEANIRGGGKSLHAVFKYISRSLLLEGLLYTVHKVPECLSLRRNRVLQPPPTQASVSPPLDPKGGASLACGEELTWKRISTSFERHATLFSAPCDFVFSALCYFVFSSKQLFFSSVQLCFCFQLHAT